MNLTDLFKDSLSKPKDKIEHLSNELLKGNLSAAELIDFTEKQKDPVKASCIEALEFASKEKPEIIDNTTFQFITACLAEKAPRIKWESAKVIGNVCKLHVKNLEKAIPLLLINSEHTGTVVRWSSAYALGEIVKLETNYQRDIAKAIEGIVAREEKNSIKKIYLTALKKIS